MRTTTYLLLVISLTSICPHGACADDLFWKSPVNGVFNNANNWRDPFFPTAHIPGASDKAIFDVAGTYTVDLQQARTVGATEFRNGDVTFQLRQNYISPITVQPEAKLSVTSFGTGRKTISGNGNSFSISGETRIRGSIEFAATGQGVRLGVTAPGTIILSNAADWRTQNVLVGAAPDMNGIVTVDSQSQWTTGGLTIGQQGPGSVMLSDNFTKLSAQIILVGANSSGTLSINSDSDVLSDVVTLGEGTGSSGTISVNGNGSRLVVTTDQSAITVGESGTGILDVSNRGVVSAGLLRVGVGVGSGVVSAMSGSELDIKNELTVANGAVSVSAESRLEIGGEPIDEFLTTPGNVHIYGPGLVETVGGCVVVGDGPCYSNSVNIYDGSVNLFGGTLKSQTVRVIGAPWNSLYGTGTVAANVENDCTLYADKLHIQGTLSSSASAVTDIHIADEFRHRTSGVSLMPLVIDGKATLNGGSLYLHRDASVTLSVGDRFHLMKYGELQGRFATFGGSLIDDTKFFALDYTKDNRLDAIVLETPRRYSAGQNNFTARLTLNNVAQSPADNLILVTHGWNSDADGWVADLAKAIKANPLQGGTWDIVTFDWNTFTEQLDPRNVAAVGIGIGDGIGDWMRWAGLNRYKNVHLLGHSAGSWLVDALADKIRVFSPSSSVHMTLFDAFVPPGMERPGTTPPVIGDSATWAEQYVDRRLGIPVPVLYTNEDLQFVHTVDVTFLDPSLISPVLGSTVHVHGWPYQWYLKTIQSPNDTDVTHNGWGFPRSFEWSGALPSRQIYPGGERLILSPFGDVLDVSASWTDVNLAANPSVVSDTGTVGFDPSGSVTLRTGSPVILTSFVETASPANLFSFDMQFLTEADGMLSLYLNGRLLFSLDQSNLPDDIDVLNSGSLWLETVLQPGIQTLIIRLDPLTDDQASVELSNIRFGYMDIRTLLQLPGDANGDLRVDRQDLAILARTFGSDTTGGFSDGDFNQDGAVSLVDLARLQRRYGTPVTTGGEPVPEPSTVGLLASAAISTILLALRRLRGPTERSRSKRAWKRPSGTDTLLL